MILINPTENLIIRENPLYNGTYIVCDRLDSNGKQLKQLGEHEGNVISAFGYFVNEKIIKKENWISLEKNDNLKEALELARDKFENGELYYGSI